MRIADVLESEQCRALFEEVNSFVTMSLKEYNDSFSKENEYSSKDIFDFVWGTVDLSKAEIIVLDSPLLQRLRRIHHLGMADYLYCNATSTRFSHTIGVIEVAGRLSRNVTKELGDGWGDKKPYEEIVRMAAVFHDTGHMIYSHVSEIYLAHYAECPLYDKVTRALTYFREKTSSNSSLHELLSVMIVNSDETKRLFDNIALYLDWEMITEEDRRIYTEYISGLIIGVPIDRKILPYSQIINGVIDADKLDYLSRDSECTKVPVAVDIARIIKKTKIVDVDRISYPEIWNDSESETEPFKILGIKNSAKKVFYQLAYARSNMFESVYYHHKVLTAETMFRDMLMHYFRGICGKETVSFADILSWPDESFCGPGECLPNVDRLDEEERESVFRILKRLRNRNLYKRVAAFSEDNISIDSLARSKAFIRNVIQKSKESKYNSFIKKLIAEYREACRLLQVQTSDRNDFVFAYVKYNAMPSAPIENGDGCFIWSSSLVKQETMEAGRKSKQEQFYLLSDCIKRDYAYLAFEKCLYSEYGLVLSRDASVCLKSSYKDLQITKKRLLEKDYYRNCLEIVTGNLLREFINDADVSIIADKYKTFQGPDGWRIDKERVNSFLKQFLRFDYSYTRIKELIDGVARLLKNGIYIDREAFTKTINNMEIKESDRITFVTIGNLTDSSAHFSYYLNDCKYKDHIQVIPNLKDGLVKDDCGDVLCFCDDGAYSGKQIVSIFQEYMGIDRDKRQTKEHHVDTLSEIEKERLRRKRIKLLFAVFNESKRNFVISELRKIGLEDVQILFNENIEKSFFEKDIFASRDQRDLVEEVLRKIGEKLVKDNKTGHDSWDEKRIREAALGYNESQQIVISFSNVPTYTIVALWMQGMVCDKTWKGLFTRTDK